MEVNLTSNLTTSRPCNAAFILLVKHDHSLLKESPVMKKNQNTHSQAAIDRFATEGCKIFVVSDLHLAGGLRDDGNYDGTENFYADHSFARFLDHLQQSLSKRKGILVINGDFIDFLRISSYPSTSELPHWREILLQAGIDKPLDVLAKDISPKEIKYGLKTDDHKSVWKLSTCIQGHMPLFKRLAQWVQDGNRLFIVKGNHDLEWYWPGVQRYLRVALAGLLENSGEALPKMNAQIFFVQDALVLDEKIHIEHGHRYEKITWPEDEPTINNTELNLPFGSFLNRYLINGLELSYPFLDNVRPTPNILKVLLKENFGKALRIITYDLPLALGTVPRRYASYILQYLLPLLLLIIFPLSTAIVALVLLQRSGGFDGPFLSGKMIGSLVLCTAAYFLAYYVGKAILSWLIKKEPAFAEDARQILDGNQNLEAVLLGHTHNPEQYNFVEASQALILQNRWYFNTGTWIPVFETNSADVRFDKTYTFIAIDLTEAIPCREFLQRWNDDAGRIDPLPLTAKQKIHEKQNAADSHPQPAAFDTVQLSKNRTRHGERI